MIDLSITPRFKEAGFAHKDHFSPSLLHGFNRFFLLVRAAATPAAL
jgi:hypothetical protein